MRNQISIILLFMTLVGICTSISAISTTDDTKQLSRKFHFSYRTTVSDIKEDMEQVRLWIPLPQSDENQTISNMSITTTPHINYITATEKEYSNKYLFLEATKQKEPLPVEFEILVEYDVTRKETTSQNSSNGLPNHIQLLNDDSNAPITPEVKRRTEEAVADRKSNDEKAGAIYDRVLFDVTYDKSGTGWGEGDINYVCDAGAGNCSDFHTLFIAMSRAADIPAYFEIGFSIPTDSTSGEIGGYHCWAWFQNDENSWTPIDASEADKHPELAQYYFGTLSTDRFAVSRGRDLILSPEPAQGPINFFIYPVVEIDGRDATSQVKRTFHFDEH